MIAPMLAPLGTLAFLSLLWLLVIVGAEVLDESGAKIAAALKRRPIRQPSLSLPPMRVRAGLRSQPMRANARWRAAA